MTGWLRRKFAPGSLAGNIGAHGVSQAVNLAVQFLSIAVLSRVWGLETYGTWLILFTLPAYLAMGDFGFVTAAANDMTAAVAQNRKRDAARSFVALGRAMMLVGPASFLIAWALVAGPLAPLVALADPAAGGRAALVVMVLVAFAIAGQQLAIAQAGMRAVGAYSTGIYVITALTAVETAAVLVAVVAGGGLLEAAAIYCAGHIAGAILLRVMLLRRAPWLADGSPGALRGEVARLAAPALAMAVVPLAYALALQGPVAVLGALAGAAAVPAFTVVRTMSRAAVQVTTLVSVAAGPNFTAASARDERERQAELVALSLGTALVVLVPAAIALAVVGPELVRWWTGGTVTPSGWLIAALAAAMLFNGLWVPLSNLLMAVNRQQRFSYAFVALSFVNLAVVALLVPSLGALGAALGAAALDAAMVLWLAVQACRLGMLDTEAVRRAPHRLAALAGRITGRRP